MTDEEMKRLENVAREVLKRGVGSYVDGLARDMAAAVLALIERVRRAEAKLEPLERFARAFAETVDAAEAHAANDGNGMQVPFHGDFAQVKKSPALLKQLQWWARFARAAADGKKP